MRSLYFPPTTSDQWSLVYEVLFVSASRIALRASPQAKGPFRWISFRRIHPSTVARTYDVGRHIPFDLSVVPGNEVSV
jgi:hypothetical protein